VRHFSLTLSTVPSQHFNVGFASGLLFIGVGLSVVGSQPFGPEGTTIGADAEIFLNLYVCLETSRGVSKAKKEMKPLRKNLQNERLAVLPALMQPAFT
jgi:hypothetical protein